MKLAGIIRNHKLGIRGKFTLSLMSIAAILLISSIISVMEYRSMSNYVSGLIAEDINSINVANKLSEESARYNLAILALIGDDTSVRLPDFDADLFAAHCDSLRSSLSSGALMPLADSVEYSYSAFMLTSLELQNVLLSEFIDTRSWYFERLQPRFTRLKSDIDALTETIYHDLETNSATFERGFYRSIIPGIVAVGVGLLLVLMLLFFVMVYYLNPLARMLRGLDDYRNVGRRYGVGFEGDDELARLNDGISELTMENEQLRRRITELRKKES